jgi:hypothetical protein
MWMRMTGVFHGYMGLLNIRELSEGYVFVSNTKGYVFAD